MYFNSNVKYIFLNSEYSTLSSQRPIYNFLVCNLSKQYQVTLKFWLAGLTHDRLIYEDKIPVVIENFLYSITHAYTLFDNLTSSFKNTISKSDTNSTLKI